MMYGMVNKALQQMITERMGAEMWHQVSLEAGSEDSVFLSHRGYPDELTYRLVAAASRLTGITATELLHDFGVFWATRTARQEYSDLMDAGGRTFEEFLYNLPNFHSRIILLFSDLVPPEFSCAPAGVRSMHLNYYSNRPGLTPFVRGLIEGLGRVFDVNVKVTLECERGSQSDHDSFLVEWNELRVDVKA